MKPSSTSGFWWAVLIGAALPALSLSAQGPRAPAAPPPPPPVIKVKAQLVKGGFKNADALASAPDGGLYFADIGANRIYKVDRNDAIAVWREHPGGPGGLAPLKDGRLVVAERGGKRIVAIPPKGSIEVLLTEFRGQPLRTPADLLADAKGGIYFADEGRGTFEGSYVLYRRPSGEVVLIDNEFIYPNGLALSLDGKLLYAVDLNGDLIYVFDVQADGSATKRRRFAGLLGYEHVATALPRTGADGMAVDSQGRLYVASDIGIQVFSPKGQHLGTIGVPSGMRSIAFGGPDRRTLYMLSATDLYRVPLLADGLPVRPK